MRAFVRSGAAPAAFWSKSTFRFALAGIFAAGYLAAMTLPVSQAAAQTSGQPAAEAAKPAVQSDTDKRAAEFSEAGQAISGPAGNPECVFVGRRIVLLMSRDDLDTALRFTDLYDRFGCPGGHVQAAFRCLAKSGYPGASKIENLPTLVHTCWINPTAQLPPPLPVAAPAAK
jgi:hypothetical protein